MTKVVAQNLLFLLNRVSFDGLRGDAGVEQAAVIEQCRKALVDLIAEPEEEEDAEID